MLNALIPLTRKYHNIFKHSFNENIKELDSLIISYWHFPHPAFSTLRIFHTRHFPHFAFSALRVFHRTLRTNCPKSLSTSSRTLQTFTQQETITPCLLFILQPIYLHNLSPHTSSQPIKSRIYQRLLYLLANQIAHQGFFNFQLTKTTTDADDDFRTGCRNVSHKQQSFSGLQSPRWSFSIKES